jgi:hypothetical protein
VWLAARIKSQSWLAKGDAMFCRNCGARVEDQATRCGQCGNPPLRTATAGLQNIADDPAMRMLLPVGRSLWAIAAGYAGLFSFLVFPAPLSLVFGICALVDMRRHPEKRGMGRAIFGTTMGALGTLVLLLFVVGIAITSFQH